MASPSAVQAGDILMRYGGAGYDGSAFPGANKAILEFRAAENWTSAAQGTYVTISTTPKSSTTTSERVRITEDGDIVPPGDDVGNVGTASKRWKLVRAVTITSGDLTFENGVRATEEGKGLAFLNDAGEKIAVLDREGNLRIKGRLIQEA